MLWGLGILLVGQTFAADPVGQTDRPADSPYVNEIAEAVDELRHVEGLAARADWAAAVDAAERVAQRYPGALCRSGPDAFVSIHERLTQMILTWPAEGRRAWLRRNEPRARREFERAKRAHSANDALRVAEQYYLTDAAADAVEWVARLAFESGDFTTPRHWFRRLLVDHPARVERGALWQRMLSIASGAAVSSASRPANSPPGGADVGQSRTDAALDEFRQAVASVNMDEAAKLTATATFAGSFRRTGFVSSHARGEALLWKFGYPDRAADTEMTPAPVASHDDGRGAGPVNSAMSIEPVTNGRRVFFHDANSAWAVDPLDPSRPIWQFQLDVRAKSSRSWLSDDEPAPLFTTTIVGGRLYTHLDRRTGERADAEGGAGEMSALVCLDCDTGRMLWRNDLRALHSEFDETRLDGAPLAVGDRLFAIVRRRKPFGFEACYLAAFRGDDGRLLWTTHIGEAPTGGYGYHRATLSHPAADGDLVFAQTNLGTVAAVSAATGNVRWLRTYATGAPDSSGGFWPGRLGHQPRPWDYSACIAWRDQLIVAPLDGDHFFILDQADGRTLKSTSYESLQNFEMMIGIVRDRLYLVGRSLVCFDIARHAVAWARQLPEGELAGRPTLTLDGVFIPTTTALLHFAFDAGPPDIHRWNASEAGNLLAVGSTSIYGGSRGGDAARDQMIDQFVVAAPSGIYGLARKEDAFARLESTLRSSPTDPLAALALADLAFNTHELERGAAALAEALRRAGGTSHLTDEGLRRRLFETAIRLTRATAVRLPVHAHAGPNGAADIALSLLDRAGQLAWNAADQVTYRLTLADVQWRRAEHAAAALVYQQILNDPSLRGTVVPQEFRAGDETIPADMSAAEYARRQIDRLIHEHGREAYEVIRREAELRLDAARRSGNARMLLRLADVYPNCEVAANALIAAAERLRHERRYGEAVSAVTRALLRGDLRDPPAAYRLLADILLDANRRVAAAEWLDRAARTFPHATFEYEGRSVTFADYRTRLFGAGSQITDCPHMNWPVRRGYQLAYDETPVLLAPRFPPPADARRDIQLVYHDGEIEAIDVRSGRSRWPRAVPCRMSASLQAVTSRRFIVTTRYQVLALDRETGHLDWKVGDYPADADAPGVDPEWIAAWSDYAWSDSGLYGVLDRGEIVAIDPSNGSIRWRRRIDNGIPQHIVATPDAVAFALRNRGGAEIVVLDARDGKPRPALHLDEGRTIQDLLADPDGRIVAIAAKDVWAFDPRSKARLWHVTGERRFIVQSARMGIDMLIVAMDSGAICGIRLQDGSTAWTSQRIPLPPAMNIWLTVANGIVYAAGQGVLVAFDVENGAVLARRSGAEFAIQTTVQPPVLVSAGIVGLSCEHPRDGGQAGRGEPAGRYSAHCVPLVKTNGAVGVALESVQLGQLAAMRGVAFADDAFLVLDGRTIVGYVSDASDESRRAATTNRTTPGR